MPVYTFKYVGDRTITISDGGVSRQIVPDQIFRSRNTHFAKLGYFHLLDKNQNEVTLQQHKQLSKPLTLLKHDEKKRFKPFIGFDKMDRVSNPKISICIVSKDGDGVIQRCIDSIHRHVKYHDYEILICDTGTTNKNVLNYYNQIKKNKVKVFMNHKYNFSKNNNYLAKQAKGEVFLFLNNDVFMTYDAVSEMQRYNNLSNLGCIGHRLVFDRDKNMIQHDGQTLYTPQGQWTRLGHYNLMQNIKALDNKNSIVEGVTGACLMLDKKIFNRVKGFDEQYIDVLQDVDLNLKVGKLGYKNFCIRKNAIIHVDHFSRKGDETEHSQTDFQKYLRDWVHKGPFDVVKDTRHSVLIVGTKKEELQKVNKSIKSNIPYEFNFYNNKGNFSFSGQALNLLSETSTAKFQFLTHQDVEFKEKEPFKKLDQLRPLLGNWGVLGIAGVKLNAGQIQGYNYFDNYYQETHFQVETVDEFAMIVDKDKGLRFDETLVGFHFYGADICLKALKRGFKNYCIQLNIFHHSGGDANLTYNGNQGWREFKALGEQLYRNVHNDFPHFATTTTLFNKLENGKIGNINYFIGSVIKSIPNDEVVVKVEL